MGSQNTLHPLLFSIKSLAQFKKCHDIKIGGSEYRQIDSLDSDQNIAPVAGTREGLFSLTQAIIGDSNSKDPVVLTQNPTYQIYEGAAEMANAEVFYFSTDKQSQNLPYLKSINDEILQRTKIMYLCSPGNPSGKVIPKQS